MNQYEYHSLDVSPPRCRSNEITKCLDEPNPIKDPVNYEGREGLRRIQCNVSTLLDGLGDVQVRT